MARIRSIKPDFWTSEQITNLSRDARLLFIGMWNFCDDAGIHQASIRRLRMEVFPADSLTDDNVSELVAEIIGEGLLHEYEVNLHGKFWLVTGWHHQKIDQPTYRHPQPDGTIPDGPARRRQQNSESVRRTLGEHSANAQRTFGECSPPEGKGREGNIPTSYEVGCGQDHPDHHGKTPDCPHHKIRELYAKHLPTLPQPRIWDGKRAESLRARWRWVLTAKKSNGQRYAHDLDSALDFFDRFFGYVAASDFLAGRDGKWTGCDLAWLVKAENFVKVIEGKYENREAT